MKNILKYIAFLLLVIAFGACGTKNLKPVLTQAAGNYNIVILNDIGMIKKGSGKFFLEFHKADNNLLVDVGKVEVSAEMRMPGMPMVNQGEVKVSDTPGRYEVKYNFEMSGTWTLTVKYDGDKSAIISLSVS